MRFLRAAIYYLVMILALAWVNLISYFIFCVLEPLGLVSRLKRIHFVQSFNRFMINRVSPSVLGLSYTVRGAHRIPHTPAVYMMKHQSAWETVATPTFLPLHTWVLKHELLWLPLFGWGLRLVDPIAIIRADASKAMKAIAQEGQERLGAGISIVIFPEGTRRPINQMGAFKAGGAFLAKRCEVMVVPIAHNAGHFWPRQAFLKKPGLITVVIGKPFSPQGLTANQINARVEHWMARVQECIERKANRGNGG